MNTNPSEPRGELSRRQVEALLRPIRPERVYEAQGQSHVAAFDVVAHLTRVFGFEGWDKELLDVTLVSERIVDKGNDKVRCWVTYRCLMRLTIRDPLGRVVKVVEEAATGSAQNMPTIGDAHDFALKNAVSYAIKRCAKDLGDQFGLSLYNRGSKQPLVGMTIVDHVDARDGANDEHVVAVDGEGDEPADVPADPPESPQDGGDGSERMNTAPEANGRENATQGGSRDAPEDGGHLFADVDGTHASILRRARALAEANGLPLPTSWDDLADRADIAGAWNAQ